ncbi:MAG: BlaI/MecI/CopY family transcriptional regulator [bacterium]|nr:BlaI/MecI/CopY family transcriptional regulator [bacterium]
MTRTDRLPELNKTELEVMKVLWKAGRLSAREVHDRVRASSGWAYSTTRTVMDRMERKELLSKVEFHGLYLYQPRISKAAGLARLVREFADKVLELDWAPVVSLFARSHALSASEIEELSQLLREQDAEEE